jgi:Na+/melibiose symporter-like transporter
MLERIQAFWRTPVPGRIRLVAICAVVLVLLAAMPFVRAMPPNAQWAVGLALAVLTVIVVISLWRFVDRVRRGS